MPVIAGNRFRRLTGGELEVMACILLAPPNQALSLMSNAPSAGNLTSERHMRSAPAQDHSGIWLRNAAAGLFLLAGAAAVVSFTAQYRLIYATRQLAFVAALEAAIPDAAALVFACLGIALALHGRRAIRARLLNLASVGTSVLMNTIAAAPGWRNLAVWAMPPVAYALASDTLIGVVRARGNRPPPRPGRRPGSGGGHPAGRARRAGAVAAAPGPGARLHPGRVPRLGRGAVPGRPRPPPGPRTPAALLAVPGWGPAADQDGPLPFPSYRTTWASRPGPPRPRRRHQRRPGPPRRPQPRLRPRRPAQGRPRRPERRPPMMIKLAVALAIVLLIAAFASWAFLP